MQIREMGMTYFIHTLHTSYIHSCSYVNLNLFPKFILNRQKLLLPYPLKIEGRVSIVPQNLQVPAIILNNTELQFSNIWETTDFLSLIMYSFPIQNCEGLLDLQVCMCKYKGVNLNTK